MFWCQRNSDDTPPVGEPPDSCTPHFDRALVTTRLLSALTLSRGVLPRTRRGFFVQQKVIRPLGNVAQLYTEQLSSQQKCLLYMIILLPRRGRCRSEELERHASERQRQRCLRSALTPESTEPLLSRLVYCCCMF